MNLDERIAKTSLEIGAIKLNTEKPFRWASGYQMPIYNDNRMLLGNAAVRRMIAEGFKALLLENRIRADIVAGTSTAGIPHATTLADSLKKPMIYIRDKPKDHGLRNLIEGIDCDSDLYGKQVVVIEDLISTGGSSVKAVIAVRNTGGRVDH